MSTIKFGGQKRTQKEAFDIALGEVSRLKMKLYVYAIPILAGWSYVVSTVPKPERSGFRR